MENPPKDKYRFVSMCMFLFGITALLPWNFFITANDYWMYKFRDVDPSNANETGATRSPVTEEPKTELQSTFTSYLVIASKVPFVFFLAINTLISHRVSPSKRIGYPLILCVALFVVTTALVYVDTDQSESVFLIVTLCCVAAINVGAAFLQGGGSGIAGALPSNYITINVYGQAAGGVFASVIQIFTLVGDTSPQASALAYFLIALFTLVVTCVAFLVLLKMPFYIHHISRQVGQHHQQYKQQTNNEERPAKEDPPAVPVLKIAKQISLHACSSIVVFWVTLSVFPAVVVLVESTNKASGAQINGRLFLPVACFLLFNVVDIIGRVLATYFPLPERRTKLLLLLSCLRVVFIPLLMLCNAHPRTLPVVFASDGYFVLFVALMSLSNGYLYSIAMTNGPKVVDTEHREVAGSMLAFCLGAGLMLGSVTSLGIVKLL